MHQQRAGLWQNATGDDIRQSQASGIEHHGAGHWIKDQKQAGSSRLHEDGALDNPDAVRRQAAQLGLLPNDLSPIDIDAGEGVVGGDKQRSCGRNLLPPEVLLQLQGPHRVRLARRGRDGNPGGGRRDGLPLGSSGQ